MSITALAIEEMNTDTMGCTVRYIMGNHDYVKGAYGEKLFESIYGPVWYSFDVGNVHYVVTPFQNGGDYISGYASDDRWKWLQNDLANVDENMNVVMFNHTTAPSEDYVISFDRKELDLKEHNLIAWIFGHYHYNFTYESNGVLNVSAPRPDCGGIDSSAAGARIINITESGNISTKTVYYGSNSLSEPQNTLWSTNLEGNILFCDTVFDEGYVYTATVDDDYPKNCGVYCLDGTNGNIVWYYKTKNSVKNNVKIQNNKLVTVDTEGNVYCLDKSSGKLLWEYKLNLGNSLGTSSGLCIDNGIIFAGSSRVITALSLENGEPIWTNERDKGENSAAEFVVINGKLLVNSHWDSLTALSITDGKELWSNTDEDIRFRSSTPVAIDDETLLVADDNAIMLVNAESGEIISKNTYDEYKFSSSAQPAYHGSVAYIPTANEGIIAFDVNSKKILWNCKTDENILFTAPYTGKGSKTVEASPILNENTLIFGANDGYIYTVNIETGNVFSKSFAGSAVLAEASLADGKLYAGTFNGCVVCYSVKGE